MSPASLTVRRLATEASVDIDEVLVTLWDLGLDDILSADDTIPPAHVDHARAALGVATRKRLRSPLYWSNLLGLDTGRLTDLLGEHGIRLGSKARKLPPGAVSRLKAIARGRGIDPLTGGARPDLVVQAGSDHLEAGGAGSKADVARVDKDHEWAPPGHEREMDWLTGGEVQQIHFELVRDYASTADPIRPAGVRSEHLLESALSRPQTSLRNELKYRTVETAAAALLHSLILNHPFHNGNKRTALVSMLVFLDRHSMVPTCHEEELFKLVLQVAQHRIAEPTGESMADREVLAVANWLSSRTRLVRKGEIPIPWRRLRRILGVYGCVLEKPATVGNRINIQRSIETRGRFGRTRRRMLQTQVFYGDEGRDVDVSTLKKVRGDLELDDMHGVDSHDFYAKEPSHVGDFIARYRKTLDRLARL